MTLFEQSDETAWKKALSGYGAAVRARGVYPFFDDVIAEAIPGIGKVEFTLAYYARYQERLRERAATLSGAWNANLVGMALWAHGA